MLKGDFSKANNQLGWEPKTSLEDLCNIMVKADIEGLSKGDIFEGITNRGLWLTGQYINQALVKKSTMYSYLNQI